MASLTPEGRDALAAELEHLVNVERPEVITRIQVARSLGDLSENADYESARHEQAFLEGRIAAIEATLRDAVIIERPADTGRVSLGSHVTIEGPDGSETYAIVGPAEAKPSEGRISDLSPIGRALIGRHVGDEVSIGAPGGAYVVRVTAIS